MSTTYYEWTAKCRKCGDVYVMESFDKFDLVMAVGVLHHLNDNQSLALLKLAFNALKRGGRLITFDGCFVEGQSKISKFILSHDRGQFVRTQRKYTNLATYSYFFI